MTREADSDPDLRRPMPTTQPPPAIPGYDLVAAVRPAHSTPGLRRWRARRRADGVEVIVTCLQTPPTPQAHAQAVELAGMLSRVHHPHVVPLRDIVTWPVDTRERFRLALVTPGEEVETLGSLLKRGGALPPGQALSVLGPVAEALQALHQHDLTHGALTATCVHLTHRGKPLVADVGLHVLTGREPAPCCVRDGYVAPELLEGFPVTQQSDAHALAAVVCHTLTGQAPGVLDLEGGPTAGAATLPAWLTEMLRQGLGSDPDARPKVHEWLDTLPELGPPAPVGRALDVSADLPQRMRSWARPPRRHDGPSRHAGGPRHGSSDRRPHGSGRPRQRPLRALRSRPLTTRFRMSLTLLLLAAVVTAGAMLVRPWDSSAASSDEPSPTPSTKTQPSTPERAVQPSKGAPTSGPTAAADRASRARSLVQGLLDARGRAWESGSGADLKRASVVGSPAWRADREDLELAREEAVDFTRVGFRAAEARVLSERLGSVKAGAPPEMVVRTRVRREPVVLRDAQGEQHRYPASTDTVVLTLRRGEQGWRLYEWD